MVLVIWLFFSWWYAFFYYNANLAQATFAVEGIWTFTGHATKARERYSRMINKDITACPTKLKRKRQDFQNIVRISLDGLSNKRQRVARDDDDDIMQRLRALQPDARAQLLAQL